MSERRSFAVQLVDGTEKDQGPLEVAMKELGIEKSGSGSSPVEVYGYTDVDLTQDGVRAFIEKKFPGLKVKVGKLGEVGKVIDGESKGHPLTGPTYEETKDN